VTKENQDILSIKIKSSAYPPHLIQNQIIPPTSGGFFFYTNGYNPNPF